MTSPDRFLARPGQSLDDHLDGVAERATAVIPPEKPTPSGNSLRRLVGTVAHLHDLGKFTSYFQTYIRERPDRLPTERETHADVGALLTLHALGAQGFSTEAAVAGFYAVLKHHGVLPDVSAAHSAWARKDTRYPLIQEKLSSIDRTANTQADRRLAIASNETLEWEQLPIDAPQRYKPELNQFTLDPTFYPLLLRVWSTLTYADKLDAGMDGVDAAGTRLDPIDTETRRPDPNRIGFETEATGVQRRLNDLRTQARHAVVEQLQTETSKSDVYTLTLPTGFGKTFAGLEAALRKAADRDGRVVYALPYTSVLDQVHGEIIDQFDVSPLGDRYTLHHHLADTRTRIDSSDERVTDRFEAMYGESWRSGLVLTTFVQLFETLAGPGNTQSMKLPALQDAVIVVDEPQILTPTWWQLVARVTTVLTNQYDATVILMTATQPRFIETSDFAVEPTELVPDPMQYFGFLSENERVRFHFDASIPGIGGDSGPRPLVDAAEQMADRTLDTGGTSLAVSNTVAAAARMGTAVRTHCGDQSRPVIDLGEQFAQYLQTHGEAILEAALDDERMSDVVADFLATVDAKRSDDPPPVLTLTLTAALRPCDRGVLIATLRRLLDDTPTALDPCPLIVSSTQLVEAGVDVSFDRVYRDFAPLPSVVQAAGRCNRSFGGDTGRVVLWRLVNQDTEREPARVVYDRDRDRLQPTVTALQRTVEPGRTSLPEVAMVTTAVEEYYSALHTTDHQQSDADQLVRAYDKARGDQLRGASMIDDTTDDILVLRTAGDVDVLEDYLSARAAGDFSAARSRLQELKHLRTSVPSDRVDKLDTTDQVLQRLGFADLEIDEFAIWDDQVSGYYDIETGLGLRTTDS